LFTRFTTVLPQEPISLSDLLLFKTFAGHLYLVL
jgi:hypothetical protein